MFEKEKKFAVRLPFGFRDIFPLELEERNKIKEIIKKEFSLWGYGEVKTPVLEYTQNISAGAGDKWKDKVINFFDVDGSLVSLRTDMTIPIARLAGMRIKTKDLPVRFCYFANSFRRSMMQKGEKRETSQAGLELIGHDAVTSDLEVLVILINVLKKIVQEDFYIGIGHIGISEGLCDWIGLDETDKKHVKDRLIDKNFVEIENFITQVDRQKAKVFLDFLKPLQGIEALQEELAGIDNAKVRHGAAYLAELYGSLKRMGLSRYLIIDPGILRQFEYYSGLLFEVYSADINETLGSGGRYDGLIKKFGLAAPATGFALDLDLLHQTAKDCSPHLFEKRFKIMLFAKEPDFIRIHEVSDRIRRLGLAVETYYGDCPDIRRMAIQKGADLAAVLDPQSEEVELPGLGKDRSIRMSVEKLIQTCKDGRYAQYSDT